MRNVLIVGASGDIGVSIAEKLANAGNYQLILHFNQNKIFLDRLLKTVPVERILGTIQADLRNDEAIVRLLDETVYPIDCIVFAAGAAHTGLFHEGSIELMDDMLALHVKAPWMITKHFLPHMIRNQQGKIVLVSSIWGSVGASNEVLYSTVKGAQNSFVRSLAKEVAQSNISVNAVSPGFIQTKMNSHLSNLEKNELITEIPANRAGTPEEIAHVVQFLLQEDTTYIHGEVIRVDGGWN